VTDGPHRGRTFTLVGHDAFLVGRSKRAHFRLPRHDRRFSRIHFLVEANPPACCLMDMGSRHGTYVNGRRTPAGARVPLRDGDRIAGGATAFRVTVAPDPADDATTDEAPADAAFHEATTLPPRPPGAVCAACRAAPAADGLLCPPCRRYAHAHPQPVPGYVLVREVGRGGMGVVWLAVRPGDGARLALKTIVPAVAGTPAQVARFLREARVLWDLRHPNVVAFRDLGFAGGMLYFAMDFVEGTDAGRLLRSEGPLAVGRAVGLVRQVLGALAYAHDKGFVHRDVKPGNVLVTPEGGREVARLADFGLARVYAASKLSGLTVSGAVGGTPAFMAPEQVTHFRDVKPAADQYSAAATLYGLLTGRGVFDFPPETHQRLVLIVEGEPTPIRERRPDLPVRLAAAVHRALAKEPKDRFPDVRAFAKALRPFASAPPG
jgi:serine/threonine-protein kinase